MDTVYHTAAGIERGKERNCRNNARNGLPGGKNGREDLFVQTDRCVLRIHLQM